MGQVAGGRGDHPELVQASVDVADCPGCDEEVAQRGSFGGPGDDRASGGVCGFQAELGVAGASADDVHHVDFSVGVLGPG